MIRIIRTKILCSFVLFICISALILPRSVCGQVAINEFSPSSDPEWVEIYNLSATDIVLDNWMFIDEGGNKKTISGTIAAQGYFVYENSKGWLNNSGEETLSLYDSSEQVIDSISYGHPEDLIGGVSSDNSIGRVPDGLGDWYTDLSWTKGTANYMETPLPTQTSSPTPTASPYKATYIINTSKDEDGNILSGVKIYVDGNYTHHEDNEILYFFNGHECYSGISCDLGTHTISLRKNGYVSWEDTQNLSAGDSLEVNPILNKLSAASPTASPTILPTSAKTPKPTPTKTPVSTDAAASESAVLGIQENFSKTPSIAPISSEKSKGKVPVLPAILVFAGLCFIAVPIFSIIKNGQKSFETHKSLDSSDSVGGHDI